MKKILLSLLCLGLLFGCNKSVESDTTEPSYYSDDLSEFDEAQETIRDIIWDYSYDFSISLIYKNCDINTEENNIQSNFTYRKCEVAICTEVDGQLKNISVKDNEQENNTYSSFFLDFIDATLQLDIFSMDDSTYNAITNFLVNSKKDTDSIDGYKVEKTKNSFKIYDYDNSLIKKDVDSSNDKKDTNSNNDIKEIKRDNIIGTSNKDAVNLISSFNKSIRNDNTNKWRLLTIAQNNINIAEYALSIYDNYWDDECNLIVVENLTTKTSCGISDIGGILEINIFEYVDGEEHDANLMLSGTHLGKYWIYLDNGDIEKI